MADVNISNDELLTSDSIDKVEEYFKAKDIIRNLRKDIADLKLQKPEIEELEKHVKKAKELREKINDDSTIKELTEKINQVKERQELLKELIRIDLLEKAQEEVKKDGKKLKIVNILKEMKDGNENSNKKKKFFKKF